MLPLNGYFEGMLGQLRPSKARRELAKSLPATVRDHLVKSSRLETVNEEPRTRLAGSYGRKTGEGDIHDVDLLVFVDPHYVDEPPEVVLDDLGEALHDLDVEGYGRGEVRTARKNRRSHHVEFKKDGQKAFHIDCVPVVRAGDDAAAVLQIPDREWTRWDSTQPIGYADRLAQLNQSNGEKVLPTIRMFKRIRRRHLAQSMKRPKSYWLEAKVYELWRDGRLSNDKAYADLVYDLLRAIRADCGPNRLVIHDPSLGHDLTATWEQNEYDDFKTMLDTVIGYLDPIANEADADRAVEAWQKVFGADVFQLSDEAQHAAAAATAAAAGATVTTGGTVYPTGSGTSGVQAPPHRFYGDR
jgi:hypothetical protein